MGVKKIEISSVTSKYQATIPESVRKILGIKKGDKVSFEVKGNLVVIRRMTSQDLQYLQSLESTLSEWNSETDEKAYADL